jgi:hypothetical protein
LPDTDHGSLVENNVNTLKSSGDGVWVADVAKDEFSAWIEVSGRLAFFGERAMDLRLKVVEDAYLVACLKEGIDQV